MGKQFRNVKNGSECQKHENSLKGYFISDSKLVTSLSLRMLAQLKCEQKIINLLWRGRGKKKKKNPKLKQL